MTAQAISMITIAVDWTGGTSGDAVAGYRLERRANLQGPFEVVAEGQLARPYFDTGLTPDTYYGYRVHTLTKLGEMSPPSVVAGAKTAPLPGILLKTHTLGHDVDGDGYRSLVRNGRDSIWATIGPSDARRFSPLPAGHYTTELMGIAANCALSGAPTHSVDVTDQGLNTLVVVEYEVRCRDPHLGEIAATVAVEGDSLDVNGFVVHLTGIADSATLPDSERIVLRQQFFPSGGGTFLFENLLPGDYELQLDDVALQCTVANGTRRNVRVTALGNASVAYSLDCPRGTPNTGGRPFVLRNHWAPNPVGPGQRTTLAISLDLSDSTGLAVSAVQSVLRYNQAALRFDSAKAGALDLFTVNGGDPGIVIWSAYAVGAYPSGVFPVASMYFTAVGSTGLKAPTRTNTNPLDEFIVAAADGQQIETLVRVVEDTVTIGAGGGGNVPPVAQANGPYAGIMNVPITLSASGSNDPDGTIASYSWAFGDGGTATGVSPTHAYAAAGTYTAVVTVTDNLGAAGTAQATVTVASAGGNQPPTAQANSPYSGMVNSPIAFTASGSSDPDGTITAYAWAFGDGASAVGASATHAYTVAGTYTATLTVTDNLGAIDVDQATVTVTAGGGPTKPFTWSGTFGTINPVDSVIPLVITLDLSADIPETPGPESLATIAVDSLKWDPTVLRYHAFNWGPGGSGVANPTDATTRGKLLFSSFTLPSGSNSGLITIATVRFKVIGAPGRSTTTATALGPLVGTVATGNYDYRPRTAVLEASLLVP